MKTTARKRVIQERLRVVVLSGAVALSGGCMVGPDYVKPKAEAPPAYKETGEWKTAEPQDHLPRGKWWEIFNDPQLNALEEQIEISNQNVQQAYAQFRQARAVVQEARAAFFPTVTVNPQVTRAKSSNTLGDATGRARHQHLVSVSGGGLVADRPLGSGPPRLRVDCRHRPVERRDAGDDAPDRAGRARAGLLSTARARCAEAAPGRHGQSAIRSRSSSPRTAMPAAWPRERISRRRRRCCAAPKRRPSTWASCGRRPSMRSRF